MPATFPAAPDGPREVEAARPRGWRGDVSAGALRLVRELLLMTALFVVYKAARVLTANDVGSAFANADRVWDAERALRLPSELGLQRLALDSQFLIETANVYYAYVHFPATAAFLLWIFLRRPVLYPLVRRAIVLLTASALLVHLAFPLAPPRMLAELGFVDTGRVYGPAVYGPPSPDSLANQYAAMPSLHVGWAVLVGFGLVLAFRSRWRWLWLLHPMITAAVVVVTANHYWIDGAVACGLLAAVTLALRSGAALAGELRRLYDLPGLLPAGADAFGPHLTAEDGTIPAPRSAGGEPAAPRHP